MSRGGEERKEEEARPRRWTPATPYNVAVLERKKKSWAREQTQLVAELAGRGFFFFFFSSLLSSIVETSEEEEEEKFTRERLLLLCSEKKVAR